MTDRGAPTAARRAFRSDVQALRALAVAGVVVYHLWPRALPGGFVGVDVFFVISGYLITQHLADEMRRTGRISLPSFWARRIRRILPAALLVLAACLGILLLLMPRVTWEGNLQEIRAAAAYVENWLLGHHAVDYLAAESSPSLVQHYWSLSVEEQFYLFWPLLLLLPLAVARRRGQERLRFGLAVVLGCVAVASFVTSVLWTAASPSMAFFATPTRAWEFAVGGLVAVLVPRAGGARAAPMRALAAWAGIGLVLWSYAGIGSGDPFPGWIAAVPVAGAATLIAAQAPIRLLALPPVQWIGDNSYSIYLWHWPLIIAAPWVTHGRTSWPDKLAILALSLVLAGITKRFVEDPVRTGPRWRAHALPAYALAVVGVAALVVASSTVYTGARHAEVRAMARAAARSQAETERLVVSQQRSCFGAAAMLAVNRCPRPYARPPHLDTELAAADGRTDPCLQHYDAAAPETCVLGAERSPQRTIAIVGNSHAWRLVPALALYGRHHGWRVVVDSRINCLGLITQQITVAGASPNCLSWSAAVQRQLLSMPRLDAVVFAGYRFADEFVEGAHEPAPVVRTAEQRILATWEALAARGIRVIVTGDVPGMRPVDDPDCLAQSDVRYDPCARDRASVVRPSLLATVAQQHPDVASYLPLTRYFCDATKCHALIGGVVVYFDSHHLTRTYSRSLARYLGADVQAAMTARRPAPAAHR
ncbi:MAG: acyltransferase family protein [Frankiaceae bacterium]